MKKAIKIIICIIIILALAAVGVFLVIKYSDNTIKNRINSIQDITEKESVRVTFPEGLTILEVAKLLEENGVCTAQEFMDAADTANESSSLDNEIKNASDRVFLLEGYIFPDTYDFYVGEGADTALSRFLKNMGKKLTDEYYARAQELGYTMDEILAIASIIQEEASYEKEMGKVSSVLHNRLNDSYNKLECDVTINYLKSFDEIDENIKNTYSEKYNTYKLFGLPAGPICNPGEAAIKAALYPEDTKYFFFVTDKDMNYYYAETYDEHKKNCKIAGVN